MAKKVEIDENPETNQNKKDQSTLCQMISSVINTTDDCDSEKSGITITNFSRIISKSKKFLFFYIKHKFAFFLRKKKFSDILRP